MPSGIAPAVVLDPANAALLAAKIFGVANAEVREQVKVRSEAGGGKNCSDDASVQ